MQFSDFKKKTDFGNLLKQVDILGSFDFYTCCVALDSLTMNDFDFLKSIDSSENHSSATGKKLHQNQYRQLAKVFPLTLHELTHFIDSTSTLWGLKHLCLMNRAYQTNPNLGGNESVFCRAKVFFDHCRKIRLPSYYTTVSRNVSDSFPWRFQISIGQLFSGNGELSDNTILFARFLNSNRELISRSPVSSVSILEASAMAQEVLSNISLLGQTESDFALVENTIFSKDLVQYIYNKNITEYSVCAHFLANHIGLKDIGAAFYLCAALCRIVLNFPQNAFCKLAETINVDESIQSDRDPNFVPNLLLGLHSNNMGILFYLLCLALPKEPLKKLDVKEMINGSFAKLGIDYDYFESEANLEAEILFQELSKSEIKPIASLASAGYQNYKNISFTNSVLPFQKLNLPPVFLGDSNTFNLFASEKNHLSNFDIEACFEELFYGSSWVRNFSEACV
ncbi:MAG: hypothetical protein C0412_07505 [Flavobacterium sp.]|nr:hypothetical protein [Flavobacterium sp.]